MAAPLPDEVLHAVGPVRVAGDGWVAKCPAHDDHNPSLSLTVNPDGRVLVNCHAGCTQDAVLDVINVSPEVLNGTPTRRRSGLGEVVATYPYRDEDGKLLYEVVRYEPKAFRQRRPNPNGPGTVGNLDGVRRVLFRLPELVAARDAGERVYIAEGEKDVLALVHHGRAATCNSGGAGKWQPEFAAYFTDIDVIICSDKDRVGQAHARRIAADLDGVARRVWVAEAPDPYRDVAEMLGAGVPLTDLQVTHRPDEAPAAEIVQDMIDFMASDSPDYDWLVPGLLARGERLMVTGFEGLGKSTWLRQWAVSLATGFHPGTLARIAALLRVLIIDCENPDGINRAKYRGILAAAARDGFPLQRDQLWIKGHSEGLDLADPEDAAWLMERAVLVRPDVLVIGPTYKLHTGNPNDEETARALTDTLDQVRNRIGCAVILEHHSPKGEGGKQRSVAPIGSSLYMRWPEFGYGLKPAAAEEDTLAPDVVKVVPWRGPRDERCFPTRLRRGGEGNWPWVEDYPAGLRAV